jgi:phenylpropionate dioxygenase-like ring-hydroxylating dioxygenase large terminal subunit
MRYAIGSAVISILMFNGFSAVCGFTNKIARVFMKKDDLPSSKLIEFPKLDYKDLTEKDKFELQWYVVGKNSDFMINRPKKVQIWNTNYAVWKDKSGNFTALHDACTHKGASLSCGKIKNDNIACPYHGYEFDKNGTLVKVPGICFRHSDVHSMNKYHIVEKNGWVYMNTMPVADIKKVDANEEFPVNGENIFVEPELEQDCSVVYLNMDYKCYSRVLSENSLDIMHIAFVHTFGNAKRPEPVREIPPTLIGPNHYKSTYFYEAGEESVARKVFDVKDLVIENEFILPHTTIARVKFGDYVSTVMTFALPIGENKSRMFVKTYRNFWKNDLGDAFTRNSMYNTMLQDKVVVENIDSRFMDGKFNMRFDKLQNTYTSFYKRFVHEYDKECKNDDCDL